jgi:hypothetical protein
MLSIKQINMRNILFLFLLFPCLFFSQKPPKPPYPKSIVDVGLGVGTNYGMIGAQAVVGYKGNGLLLAAGLLGWEIGVQGSYKWAFASVSYGTYNIASDGSGIYGLHGIIIMAGGKINLVRSKKIFLEIGAGYAGGDGVYLSHDYVPINGPTATLGFGYRIAKKVKEPVSSQAVEQQ